ncbi:MAG: rRNA maturation RNase YbeY [Bdellovibrionales bacterium]|nr:rRNA maturation RNase YbeY [Bdellovibrionales bacterium]
MKTMVLNQSRDRVSPKWVSKWMAALTLALAKRKHKGLNRKEIVVVFVNSGEMKRMNRMYRGKDYATDILSFESAEEQTIGELVLCLPTIRSQSRRTGLSERGELGYMLVHGVLHLLGYDHADRQGEEKMFALQDELYGLLEKRVGLR